MHRVVVYWEFSSFSILLEDCFFCYCCPLNCSRHHLAWLDVPRCYSLPPKKNNSRHRVSWYDNFDNRLSLRRQRKLAGRGVQCIEWIDTLQPIRRPDSAGTRLGVLVSGGRSSVCIEENSRRCGCRLKLYSNTYKHFKVCCMRFIFLIFCVCVYFKLALYEPAHSCIGWCW